jgi:hypothetical protein
VASHNREGKMQKHVLSWRILIVTNDACKNSLFIGVGVGSIIYRPRTAPLEKVIVP